MAVALENTRIADFSHVFAGPHCTMVLADLGAEVIKIEPPNGDASRSYSPPDITGESPAYLCLNRNKKGVVINLSTTRGQDLARQIVATCDVLVENFATGVMRNFGLDYASLQASNPSLIYCSISAYGRDGPFARRPGFDPVIQAESGLMSLNGAPDRPPYRTGIPFVDLCTGMFATQAILAALISRARTGAGQFIDVPLFDSATHLAGYQIVSYLAGGVPPGRFGNSSSIVAPAGLYDATDGQIFLTVGGDRVWRKLLSALDDPPELACPCFATNSQRLGAAEHLNRVLQSLLGRNTVAWWLDRLRGAGVPAGPLRDIAQVCDSPELRGRAMIGQAPHATAGTVPDVRTPWTMQGTPSVRPKGAPVLGEHTRSVLQELLGIQAEQVDSLAAEGIIRCAS